MEVVARATHVEPGIGRLLNSSWTIPQCIMGVVVGLWALEGRIVLWEIWLDEGDPVCWINAGQEGGAKSLKDDTHTLTPPNKMAAAAAGR